MPGNWTCTFTGKKFVFDAPTEDMIDVRDIAHHLSLVNRFCGATRIGYSVAEHSVRVARLAYSLCDGDIWAKRDAARYGLLHDASEAYMQDMPGPAKNLPELAGYRKLEKRVMRVILNRFGLDLQDTPECVKTADSMIVNQEARVLHPAIHPDWKMDPPLAGFDSMGWTAEYAEKMFRDTFNDLFVEVELTTTEYLPREEATA